MEEGVIEEAVKDVEDPKIRELVKKMLDPEPWSVTAAIKIE